MELPNPDDVTVKVETGTGGVELLHTDMDIDQSDVKQECLEYSTGVEQTTDSVTVKIEPLTGPEPEGGVELLRTDVDTELPHAKKKCLEYSIGVEPATVTHLKETTHGELDSNSGKLNVKKKLPDSTPQSLKIVEVHRIIAQSDIVYYLLKDTPFSKCPRIEKLKIVADGRPTPALKIIHATNQGYNRNFKPHIYNKFWWLTGSLKLNRMFCWPCLLFSDDKNIWNALGYNDMCHYNQSAMTHEQKKYHYRAVLALSKFQSDKIQTSLSTQNSDEILRHNEIVEQNRCVFRRLIDVICFLAKQETPFLGKNESVNSSNRGNFLECLNLLSQYDGILGNHLRDHKSVFKGVSDDKIKNGIVKAISCVIINKIKCEVNNSDFVALIVEETPDVSGAEQLCFVLRYVTGTTITERFLGFVDVSVDRNVENITEVILNKLREYSCISKLVAQAYDGAAFMSSCKTDVQKNVKLQCPHAMFVWCSPHNFVLSKSCERIPEARNFFHIVKSIGNFFQPCTKRTEFYNRLCGRRMPHVAIARWGYNSQSMRVIYSERLKLIELFENITDLPDHWDGESVSLSKSFLFSLRDFEFIFFLHIYEQIFKRTDKLLKIVQKETTDTESCINEIKQFECFMKDLSFDSNYTSAIALTKEPKRKRNIDDIKFHYLCIFQEIRNNILSEINARYGSMKELTFIELLEPEFFNKFDAQFPSLQLKNLTSLFPLFFDLKRLKNELKFVYSSSEFAEKKLAEILDLCVESKLNLAFPQIFKLVLLLATIPTRSASEKGSFSALKRIHTYLRSMQNQKRNSDLSIIAIEKELLTNLKSSGVFYDDVIREFLKIENRIPLAYALGTEPK